MAGGAVQALGPGGPPGIYVRFFMRSSITLHSSYILLSHKIFLHESFLSFTKNNSLYWEQVRKSKCSLKIGYVCQGGQLGLRPWLPPFCMKSAGAPEAGGGRWGLQYRDVWGKETPNRQQSPEQRTHFEKNSVNNKLTLRSRIYRMRNKFSSFSSDVDTKRPTWKAHFTVCQNSSFWDPSLENPGDVCTNDTELLNSTQNHLFVIRKHLDFPTMMSHGE